MSQTNSSSLNLEKVKTGRMAYYTAQPRTLVYGYHFILIELLKDGKKNPIAEDYMLVNVTATPLKVSILALPGTKFPKGTNITFDGSQSYDPDVSEVPGNYERGVVY